MTRKKTTKYALLSSVMAMVLSIAMLIGTTFAWFTDTVTSGTNHIIAGNLDVKLYHSDKAATDEEVTPTTKLFDDIALWEPGAMVYENFKIENAGSLALKYVFNLKVTNATVVDGKSLADVLKVAVVEGGVTAGDRAAALAQSFEPISSFDMRGALESTKSQSFGIIIYWEPGENDNDYNLAGEALKADIAVDLFATQLNSESDSFDNDFDAGASLPVTLIKPITKSSDNTLAAPVSLGATAASDVSSTAPIHIHVPEGVKLDPSSNDFVVKVEEAKSHSSVVVNPASDAIAFEIEMPLASDNTMPVAVTLHIGTGLNLTAVYHDGTEMIEANTSAANTYVYDDTTGNITMYITKCSVFTFVHGADFAVSNSAEITAALSAAKAGDIIALTADIDTGVLQLNGKNVAFDLNGKSLNTAKLEVIDSTVVFEDSSNGEGTLATDDSSGVINAVNSNVTIENGRFVSNYNKAGSSGYANVIQVRNSELTINGGYFENNDNVGSYNRLIKANSYSTTEKTTITINGGEFVSHRNYGYIVSGDSDANVEVVINGGKFKTTGLHSFLTNVKGSVVVNDCTFTATGNHTVFNIPKDSTVTVKGGTFSVNENAYSDTSLAGLIFHRKTNGWTSVDGTLLVDPVNPVKVNQPTYSGFLAEGATQSDQDADGFYTITK